jgi:hypothetical protein
MSSTQTHIAQPLTKNLVNTADQYGVYFFRDSDFSDWVAANSGKISIRDGSFYTVAGSGSGSTFLDVVLGNNGATELNHTLANIADRKTIRDLGKQIYIGDGVSSDLLVFRKVQEYSDTDGGGRVGYVVVQNNSASLGGNNGRFTVRVARV